MAKNLRNWKERLLYVALLACINSCDNNNSNHSQNNKNERPEYNLPVPKGWQVERFLFPIGFAPQIAYKGAEDLRFTPGWESPSSEEHWSYAFLWWLEGTPKIDTEILQENLKVYYAGLTARNISQRNIPAGKVIPTVATIKKIDTATSDIETYSGTIIILDYLNITYNPITLNCLIHKKSCSTQNHTALFFEISPKPFGHKIWQQLNKLQDDFECGK